MQPLVGTAKLNKLLTQFSQRYTNKNYIATQILPKLMVKEKTGNYAKYGTENLRVYAGQLYRAPGAPSVTVDYSVSQGEYLCRERSLKKFVPVEAMKNTDQPYDPKRDAVQTLMDIIYNNMEYALATYMGNTANITQNVTLSGGDQWDDYTNSTPLDDIETAISDIVNATGQRPNTCWMGFETFRKLKAHPDVREQVKYTNGGQLSDSAFVAFLKEFFMLNEVFVGTAIYDSADEGQTASLTQVWGKNFWLGYKNASPTLMQATMGYTFFDEDVMVEEWAENDPKGEWERVHASWDQNVMDASLIYLIKDAVS